MGLLILVVCLGILQGSQSFEMPEGKKLSRAEEKMKETKGMADEMGVTEEQFFECFTDMNCFLGERIRSEMFGCYNEVKPEEVPIYAKWFEGSPKGHFDKFTIVGVNTEFCTLSRADQREVNEYFGKKFSEEIDSLCKSKSNISKCKRISTAWNCIQTMFEKYIPDGTCNGTIVAKAQEE